MTVPLWVLKAAFHPYGARLPKKPELPAENVPVRRFGSMQEYYEKESCCYCGGGLFDREGGYRYDHGEYMHIQCDNDFRAGNKEQKAIIAMGPVPRLQVEEASWKSVPRRERRRMKHAAKVKFPEETGNLDASEYRYWIGVRYALGVFAICRCCQSSVYGLANRDTHQDDPTFRFLDTSCARQLTSAYSLLLCKKECVVCGKGTKQKRWGIPLCGEGCETEWKFQSNPWPRLEAALSTVKERVEASHKRLLVLQKEAKSGGSETSESTSSLVQP